MSHLADGATLKEFHNLRGAMGNDADVCLLLHQPDPGAGLEKPVAGVFAFTNGDLDTLTYPFFAKTLIPGSAHFPLLYFFSQHSNYEYYWLIEYDVRFSGDWRTFFQTFQQNQADFLSSAVFGFAEDPGWIWWQCLTHPVESIPVSQRLRSFNPVYRISNPALRHLHKMHLAKWRGHFEVLIPTLLFHGGFDLEDFGGRGRFTPPRRKNKFYVEGPQGTFRWRPAFAQAGPQKNKLYHPVKLLPPDAK